ncbi:MAG: trehalose-phosphatase [Betaproteobacteria bacterium]
MPPALDSRCALFLDIDGTLAEIAATPDAVQLHPAFADLLPDLQRELGGAVAIVTGRSITSADALLSGLVLPMAGQHGCERRDAEGAIHLHATSGATQNRLRDLLEGLARRHPQLMLEDKGATMALHYRATPQLASHVHQTMRRSMHDNDGFELLPGRMLLEVRPEGRDKGTSIADFMAEPPFAGRVPVFVGDDKTDEHGFDAVEKLGGWSVKVGPGRTSAQFRLANPVAVRRWLLAPIETPPQSDSTTIKR